MPDKDELENLVRGIVLAQGNVFIKELLRERGITIGVTKADFERNMLDAIGRGDLTLEHIERWLQEVEGWGDQHVYLFNVSRALAKDELWTDDESVRKRVEAAGYGSLWKARTSCEFPPDPELTSISFDGSRFRMTWHEGSDSWIKDQSKDFQETINADLYEFRAFRRRADRIVTRFELDLRYRLAGIFTPLPANSEEHKKAIEGVEKAVGRIVDLDVLKRRRVVIATVLKKLDQANVENTDAESTGGATSQSTRLTSGGAYVEFGSRSRQRSFIDSEAVRDVRLSIREPQLESFTGTRGTFLFPRAGPKGSSDQLRVQLYGNDKRIRLWAQMTEREVWAILDRLKTFQ